MNKELNTLEATKKYLKGLILILNDEIERNKSIEKEKEEFILEQFSKIIDDAYKDVWLYPHLLKKPPLYKEISDIKYDILDIGGVEFYKKWNKKISL